MKDEGSVEIYEIGYHILSTVAEGDVQAEVSKIKEVIAQKAGTLISEEFPEMRALAYDITKKIDTRNFHFNKAFFGWVKFELDRSMINDIKNTLDRMPTLLRFIIVKTVRENTMHTLKTPQKKEEVKEEEVEVEKAPVAHASEEEIDKSIDELVVEETV